MANTIGELVAGVLFLLVVAWFELGSNRIEELWNEGMSMASREEHVCGDGWSLSVRTNVEKMHMPFSDQTMKVFSVRNHRRNPGWNGKGREECLADVHADNGTWVTAYGWSHDEGQTYSWTRLVSRKDEE